MDTELQKTPQEDFQQYQEKELPAKPINLEDSLYALEDYGGMRILKMLIRETENFDPRRKALRDVFLSDSLYKETRKKLAKTLDIWIDLLDNDDKEEDDDVDKMIAHCLHECKRVENNISENLFTIREEIKELEKTYRVLYSFFANADKEKVDFLNLININKEDIGDMSSKSSRAVAKELDNHYNTLDLRESYSLFVLPGYLGDVQEIDAWAAIAHKNKALLITDFEDSMTYEDLIFRLNKSYLQGSEINKSNIVLTCNYILGRRRSELSAEEEDLYIPSSGAIAGRMTNIENIPISQGIAGKKFGSLDNAPTVRYGLLKSELTKLIDLGVVPLVEIDGQVMAFSNRTPYEGSISELQEYPIVRVFNWVSKVIQQFCNDEAFVIWDATVKSEMTDNIQRFLGKYKGDGKLYENYAIKGINQDPKTKNILVQIELKPFFAAKNFLIELTGKTDMGKMTTTWEENIK